MFRLSYFTESEVRGTIYTEKSITRLGNIEDINGKKWHINAVIGKCVCAVPSNELHPYYTDTSNNCFNYGIVSQKWHPYYNEVVR